jgi:hypothetical protein
LTFQYAEKTPANTSQFLGQASAIPEVGKIELAWVSNPAPTPSTTTKTEASAQPDTAAGGDAKMVDAGAEEQSTITAQPSADEVNGNADDGDDNYDVADDEDRWMAA